MRKQLLEIFSIRNLAIFGSFILFIGQSCIKSEDLKEKAKLIIESELLDTLSKPDSYEFISITELESFDKENVVHRIEMAQSEIKSAKSEIEHNKEMQKLDVQKFGESGKSIRQNSIDYDTERIKVAEKELNLYNSILEVEREIYLYATAFSYYVKDKSGITTKSTCIVTFDYDFNIIDCQKL